MRFLACLAAAVWLLSACGDDSQTLRRALSLEPADHFDPNINVFANSGSIKVETPFWRKKFNIRLLDENRHALTSTVRMTSETYTFPGLTPETRYWVEYDFKRDDGSTKHGLLTMRTMTTLPEGYMLTTSLLAGETQPVYISSTFTDVTVTLHAFTGDTSARARWRFTSVTEAYTSRIAASAGCDFAAAGAITVPADLPTGYYQLVLQNAKGKTSFPFVIRPAKPGAHKLAIVASTNTWNAYNGWGDASYYHNQVGGPMLLWSSFDRPLGGNVTRSGHLVAGEVDLALWLEKEGIAYDVYSDADVDAGRLGDTYNTWIFHVHSEYWTAAASHNYSEHLKAGKRAIFLSGNNMWWLVSYINNARRMYKNGYHGNRDTSNYTTTLYSKPGYGTTAPYRCLAPDHWVFEGTGLKKDDLFGANGKYGGASGHETDKVLMPRAGLVRVAKGENPGNGGADMVVAPVLNGEIFNVGSITFNGALESDAVVSRILRNVIRRYNGQ